MMSNESTTTGNNSIVASEALKQIFTQQTPKQDIRTRQGRGGKVLLYTDGAYVIRTLNEAFSWNWDFEADHEEILWIGERPFEARCRGKLTVRIGEVAVTKMQFGSQPIEMLKDGSAPVSLGDAYKGAATDALKKCASLLGIALDLYDSDSEVNTANPQQVQRDIQQAKQQATKPPVTVEQPKGAVPVIEDELDKLAKAVLPDIAKTISTPNGIPNSPKLVIEAVTKAVGQDYYKAAQHLYNVIGKYPNSNDLSGWADYLAAAIAHAELRSAEKANETQTTTN